MTTTIRYSYMDDSTERTSAREVDIDAAIAAAAAAIDAKSNDDGQTWIHHDDAARSDWRVSARDMTVLGAALLDGHSLNSVYSVWCANSVAVEVEPESTDDRDAWGH